MAERQPGLLPIIPPFPQQRGPSPLIPVIVLLIIAILRWAVVQTVEFWSFFDTDAYSLGDFFSSIQSQFLFSAILIPLCLMLAIQAFGIPQVNPVRNAPPQSPFVKAITQNMSSSIILLVVILALVFAGPIRGFFQFPWLSQDPSVVAYSSRDRSRASVCRELAGLQKRCELWKGNARDSVCRELAILQRRCERGAF